MQIIFFAAFGMLLITLAMFGSVEPDVSEQMPARAAAAHMSVYHAAAVTKCREEVCASGLVDPEDYMNEAIVEGPLYDRRYFQSNYDAPTKTLVTYMKPGFALRGAVNFATVNAALKDMQKGDSTSFGAWDRDAQRVIPNYLNGYAVNYVPPAGIAAVLPDEAPVIVSRN